MFADFREYYNLRLSDVLEWDGSLPVWEAAILAKELPHSSRTMAMIQGGKEYWGWTLDRHLLATIVDLINVDTFAFVQAHSKKKVQTPAPTPRPGDEERKKEQNANNPFAQMVKMQMQKLNTDTATDAKEA